MLERNIYGGQIANTPEVENYPGIKHISGVELAMALYDQVTALGVEIKLEAPGILPVGYSCQGSPHPAGRL